MKQPEPQYLGVPIFFAGKTWLVPALSVLQFQQYIGIISNPAPTAPFPENATAEQRAELEQQVAIQRFAALMPVVGAALRRNYPDLTDDMLYEHLDMNTFWEATRAVQAASNLKAVKPGEAETQPTAT